MSIEVGDHLPDITLHEYIAEASKYDQVGPKTWRLPDLAHKKKVVAIGVIGAFTPICTSNHLPGYLEMEDDFKAKGIDELWCISVNDPFVLHAWSESLNINGRIRMLGDGSAELVTLMDVTLDLTSRGMGVRSDRFAMVVDNGEITHFYREETGCFCLTSAENMLKKL